MRKITLALGAAATIGAGLFSCTDSNDESPGSMGGMGGTTHSGDGDGDGDGEYAFLTGFQQDCGEDPSATGGSSPGSAGASSEGGQGGASVGCEDEYPFDDGYSCEEQAGWGKCDEAWMEGYCLNSCERCDWVPSPVVCEAGARNVFEEYTPKENLAPTPPMGWNSWNKFACDIDEDLIKETAAAMVESGMAAVGYEYVNIDDCWQADERDDEGNIQPDPERFPSGIKPLADYVHDLGLKLGIYSDRGYETCGGRPGSFGYEIQDAETYAEWGIDYLKYDNCAIPDGREEGAEMAEDYLIMGEALRQSGRDVVYSVCAWWFHDWMVDVGHLWRTTTDIKDDWDGTAHAVTRLLNLNGGDTARYGMFNEDNYQSGAYAAPGLAQYAGPSAWNDPDMLEVGNGGQTDTEYRSHFSLWALMAAPLIAGNDLRRMDEETLEILTNEEVIAVNQDALGIQGVAVSSSITLEVWSKKLSGDDTYAVILFNRSEESAEITADFEEVGLSASKAEVRDLWKHEDLGEFEDEFSDEVPAHGVVMVTMTGK